jgi:hypothetical protein
VFLAADGRRLDRHGAGADRPQDGPPGRDRQDRHAPTRCGTRSSSPHWMQEYRCGTRRRPPRTPIRGRRCGTTGPAAAWTGTQPTSSLPTSQAPLGNPRVLGRTLPSGGHDRQTAALGRNPSRTTASTCARTADLDACAQNGTAAATAPEGLFCGAVPARAGMDTTCWHAPACPVRRDHPEAGLTRTRKAVASLRGTCPPRTRRRRAGSGRLGNAAGRRRPGDRGVYSVPVVSAKISSAIW